MTRKSEEEKNSAQNDEVDTVKGKWNWNEAWFSYGFAWRIDLSIEMDCGTGEMILGICTALKVNGLFRKLVVAGIFLFSSKFSILNVGLFCALYSIVFAILVCF